jgi:hypothetical protein
MKTTILAVLLSALLSACGGEFYYFEEHAPGQPAYCPADPSTFVGPLQPGCQ